MFTTKDCSKSFLTLICFVLLCSCQTSSSKIGEADLVATVKQPAGSTIDFITGDTLAYLGTPVHRGMIDLESGKGLEVVVIGRPVSEGTRLSIQQIGGMKLKIEGKPKLVVLAIPTAKELKSIDVSSFIDFATRYHAAQLSIKDWYINARGLGSAEFVEWVEEGVVKETIK